MQAFAKALEKASLQTITDGIMTKDLVELVDPGQPARAVDSQEFMQAIAERLQKLLP